MATYFVNSAAAGTASGADWTNAFLTLTAGLAAATADGDIVKVHYAHLESNTTISYTALNHISIISVDKDNSDALRVMGTTGYIRTTSGNLNYAGAFRVFVYGLTTFIDNAAARILSIPSTDGAHWNWESCHISLRHGSSSTSAVRVGGNDAQAFCRLLNCTLKFGNVSNVIVVSGHLILEGCDIEATGVAPTNLIGFSITDSGGGHLDAIGCDLSFLGANNLVANSPTQKGVARFSQCKLGASYVMLETQTHLNRSSAEVYIFDCHSGDTHGLFGYADPMGSVVSDTGIFFTSGAAAQSWKITTTANCSYSTPFTTPWFGYYNTVTTAITPYAEILRDGSTTAYQDDEVWCNMMAKVTDASTRASFSSDRMTLLGTPANQAAGAGLGSWTGEGGSAWSGKVGLNATITPAEVGHISMQFVVGEPSITVYADPQIRT